MGQSGRIFTEYLPLFMFRFKTYKCVIYQKLKLFKNMACLYLALIVFWRLKHIHFHCDLD